LEPLVATNPAVDSFQLELASIYDSLGIAQRRAGLNREASAAFARARELCEALVKANPTDPKFAHELIRTVGNWTNGLLDERSNRVVLPALERIRAMLETVSRANPTNLIMQADLAWIETLIGTQQASAGRHAEALGAYERALLARERLSTANPVTTRHIAQQIYLHCGIAALHEQAGRPADAVASLERGRLIGEKASDSTATAPEILEQLAYIFQLWGDFALHRGDLSGAKAKYKQMLATVSRLAEAHPAHPTYRSRWADGTRRLGTVLLAEGRPAKAIVHFGQSLAELDRLEKPTPVDFYDMACCRSLISQAASEAGSGLTAAQGVAEAERAVAGLRRAFDAGYSNLTWARKGDPDLKPIRSRRDFQMLILDLTFPAQPFGDAE
jgi:tetratricopeptide (TPR) repeat protein